MIRELKLIPEKSVWKYDKYKKTKQYFGFKCRFVCSK